MTRGGKKQSSQGAERRCVATGESFDASKLLRFVVGPDGALVPDLSRKLPGRGIWVQASRKHVQKAAKKGLFARAARATISVPDNLADLIEELLATRLVQALAITRKAGLAVCGFEKVKSNLSSESAELLFQASDGSGASKSKLRPPKGPESLFECLDSQELGLAFGRDHVIHAALTAGGATERVRLVAQALSGFRTASADV